MKLIVGLGNPEPQYDRTRHNVGFLLMDKLAASWGASWQEKSKFKALIAEVNSGGEKALLIKPTTYYNNSGEAVRALVDFYKLSAAQDVLVIHDELALPFGTLRTRPDGSDAGNNGIKSIIAHVGVTFARIRVGVANELSVRTPPVDFVLGRLSDAEMQALDDIATHVQAFIESFIHPDKTLDHTSLRIQKDQP